MAEFQIWCHVEFLPEKQLKQSVSSLKVSSTRRIHERKQRGRVVRTSDFESEIPGSIPALATRQNVGFVARSDPEFQLLARHFTLPNHSQKHMAVCGLSLHLGNTESRKIIEQKFIFQIGTLSPCGINERFSFLQFSYIILLFVSTNHVAPPSLYK